MTADERSIYQCVQVRPGHGDHWLDLVLEELCYEGKIEESEYRNLLGI